MAHRVALLYIVLLTVFVWATSMASAWPNKDWAEMCNKCKCVWANGKKAADCTGRGLSDVPMNLSSEIRELDFSNNPFYGLGQEVMARAELRDAHKLKFQNCSLETVHKTAFKGLRLLIELDLSKNSIHALDQRTFRDNPKLRVLSLSYNNLKRLEEGLFYNLTHLQKILLNNNEIDTIDNNVFVLLPVLQHINLGYNKLTVITYDFTENLSKLNSLNLEGNPWICDCHLQAFRNKTIKESLITAPTECDAPPPLKGRLWSDSVVFACLPRIVEPLPSTQIQATSSNVTLICRVEGEPQPDVDWVTNGRIIEKDPRQNIQRFIISKQKVGEYTWNNLTITNVNYRDRGDYKCVAKNPGGVDEKNVSLFVSASGGGGSGGPLALGSILPLVIGLSVGVLVVLVVILLLVCCCCKRNTHGMNGKRRDLIQTSDECIHLHGGQPEMEKALITDVNPVVKPPRVCSVPPSSVISSGGTEVSEAKKNLLDSDSVFAGDDESRSLDFENSQLYGRKSQNHLLESDGYHHHLRSNNNSSNLPYPPDLLPFPAARMYQVSPAGSSASTVADTTRLPPHHGPQSPLQSPIYEQINLYRTLPYSRSQSPFVGPTTARVPRQGYVTIPRRPRQQSWSSEPPPSSTTAEMMMIGEPLYDNLGIRNTADGSSAISLNKLGTDHQASSTPKSLRMFPHTTTAMSPTGCDPIAEHHEMSSPPLPAATATLPRNLESTKLSPSRTGWAIANVDALRTPEPQLPNRRNSMPSGDSGIISGNNNNKVTKIAPIPPPKPKKRTSTGPLFEDEGEDGTEV